MKNSFKLTARSLQCLHSSEGDVSKNKYVFRSIVALVLCGVQFVLPAQDNFKPKGIVLIPFERAVSPGLKDSVNSFISKAGITEELKKQFIPDKLPPNWKQVRGQELKVLASQDYFSLLGLQLERDINYKLVAHYDQALIYVVRDSSKADLASYKKLVEQHKVDWIINPYSVTLSTVQGKIKLDVKFQLYYHALTFTMINTTVAISESAITDCNERKLLCLLNMASLKMAEQAVDKIERVR